MNHHTIIFIFKISLLITLLLSFYIFIQGLIIKHKHYNSIYNNWQFPMLLAIFVDALNKI
jgi:hypothetical protein